MAMGHFYNSQILHTHSSPWTNIRPPSKPAIPMLHPLQWLCTSTDASNNNTNIIITPMVNNSKINVQTLTASGGCKIEWWKSPVESVDLKLSISIFVSITLFGCRSWRCDCRATNCFCVISPSDCNASKRSWSARSASSCSCNLACNSCFSCSKRSHASWFWCSVSWNKYTLHPSFLITVRGQC